MIQFLFSLKSYLKYYSRSKTIFDVHSPFLFDFMTMVFDTSREFYAFKQLEFQRKRLLSNKEVIEVVDLGAGSRLNLKSNRKISSIAATSLGTKNKCRLLFSLVNIYRPKRILELGTSLGLSSLYMSAANSKAIIDTIEGSASVAKVANNLFVKNKAHNIKQHIGNFDNVLPQIMKTNPSYDMIFIDGNHTYEATLKYFNLLIDKVPSTGLMVFDDIHWSPGMYKAWKNIVKDKRITLSIDLFDLGIVFFKQGISKQNISVIDYYKKPWRIGLF